MIDLKEIQKNNTVKVKDIPVFLENSIQGSKAKKLPRVVFKHGANVLVFRYGTTANDKICADKKKKIVQTYTFSRSQFDYILNILKTGGKANAKDFFSIADTNCLDCVFNSYGLCYTHKYTQYSGFISMLKSICKGFDSFESLPSLNDEIKKQLFNQAFNTYVRFGTYGEPSAIPIDLVDTICSISETWTGYTHQWLKRSEYAPYFMASVHNIYQESLAHKKGFRAYIATEEEIEGFIQCPASKEAGYKSSCAACGLCSGALGAKNIRKLIQRRENTSVKIFVH